MSRRRPAGGRLLLALGATGFALTLSGRASADPQYDIGLITGVCGTGTRDSWWDDTCFWNGLRADVIYGRSRSTDAGIGPHLAIDSAGFDDARLGGGATAVLPLIGSVPFVLSAGGYARTSSVGWEPGLSAQLMIGSRSYNFHSSYGYALGLVGGVQMGLGDSRETAIVIAAQIDGLFLAMPFIFGYTALRGPPED